MNKVAVEIPPNILLSHRIFDGFPHRKPFAPDDLPHGARVKRFTLGVKGAAFEPGGTLVERGPPLVVVTFGRRYDRPLYLKGSSATFLVSYADGLFNFVQKNFPVADLSGGSCVHNGVHRSINDVVLHD